MTKKKKEENEEGIQLKLDSVWIRYTKASKGWGGRKKKESEDN